MIFSVDFLHSVLSSYGCTAFEPTGNLDPETSEEILRLLSDISRNSQTAVLLASHDYMTLQKFPFRTLKCEKGTVMEGSVMEVV